MRLTYRMGSYFVFTNGVELELELGIKITDKIPNEEISVKTNTLNIIKHITNTKWRWAGHVARMQDNRWTIRTTE